MNYDNRVYGTKIDEIDPFFKAKREWSKVKDKILGSYINMYLKTIYRRGRPIIIVDPFSGPGQFGDGSDGSPLIITKEIEKLTKLGVEIKSIFSDVQPAHRIALKGCIEEYIQKGIAEKPLDNFTDALTRALAIGKRSTLFFYLDPYGIKDLEFETVKQIYERNPYQSTEVLINFSYKTFMRMSGNWSYDDSSDTEAAKVKQGKIDTTNRVMGGDYWIEIITDPTLDKTQREDKVVDAYMKHVRKYFTYTHAIPVKELDDSEGSIPRDNIAKYHLIFGTRSPRAVVYMNDAAYIALKPYFKQFEKGLLFPMTPSRYQPTPLETVKEEILEIVDARPLKRPDIYEKIVPKFFLEYRSKEYRAIIDDMTFKERRLFPDPRTLKKKTQLNNNTLLSSKPWPGGINS
ncbi:MAG: three-Cys-motif partner protein TcmP [Nitrospiria bacterium]